jgi:hypothetical protein
MPVSHVTLKIGNLTSGTLSGGEWVSKFEEETAICGPNLLLVQGLTGKFSVLISPTLL